MIVFFLILETFFRAYFNKFSNRIVEGYESHGRVQNKYMFFKTLKSQNGEIKIRDPKFIKNGNSDFYVAIIGDSVTAGYGLSYNNTFYYIAENLLTNLNLKKFLTLICFPSIRSFQISSNRIVNTFLI